MGNALCLTLRSRCKLCAGVSLNIHSSIRLCGRCSMLSCTTQVTNFSVEMTSKAYLHVAFVILDNLHAWTIWRQCDTSGVGGGGGVGGGDNY